MWPAREVSLVGRRGLTPVVVGIWDGGSDTSLFPGRVFTDPHPTTFDPHGLATDLNAFVTHGDLYPLTAAQEREYRETMPDILGIGDIEAGLDTPRASIVKHKIATLPPAQSAAFQERLALFSGTYGHGTHVAGIALRDNPAARLLVGRLTYNYKLTPPAPSDALVARMSRNIATFVHYFKVHHVRVVNMSFYDTEDGYEHDLEANGLGKDAAGRKAMAQRWYAQLKKAYRDAFASAPEILFVACAANFNNDATFSNIIPASIDLPNLLTVGAVDQAGDPASWTSYGPTVRVYADGYAVVSLLPHGYHVAESGTSMAAPNVTNLAAKMIAIDPALTPTKTIALILAGATKSADGKRLLINPRATLALLQAHT
jgi:subtilisin family serine protease